MGNKWDPIDPADIVDLWVDFGDLIPDGSTIVSHTVTPPDDIVTVADDLDGTKIRWRTGPNPLGKYLIRFHVVTDADEEYDADVSLPVQERVKK